MNPCTSCNICDNCKKSFGSKMCFIPTKDNKFVEWKKSRLVLNDDSTCDFYDPKNLKDRIFDVIKGEYYRTCRFFSNIYDFFKYNIILRIRYGFDIRDSWSVYSATAEFMRPRLRRMIDKDPHGCPSLFTDRKLVEKNNLAPYFSGELKDEWFTDTDIEEPMKAWLNVLEAIYYSVEFVTDEFGDKFNYFYKNEYGEDELDKEKSLEVHNRVDEGFRLLGLFFQNLWD